MSARGEGAGQPSTSAQGQPAAPAPQKRGRGRPRKQQQEPTCEPSPKRPREDPKAAKTRVLLKQRRRLIYDTPTSYVEADMCKSIVRRTHKAEAIGEKRPRGRPRKWPQQVVQKKPAQEETEETSSQESAEED